MSRKNPNAKKFARYCVQCKDSNGVLGDFVFEEIDGKWVAISPIFQSLQDLFIWMKLNHWETYNYDEDGNSYTPFC